MNSIKAPFYYFFFYFSISVLARWNVGIRRGQQLVTMNGERSTASLLNKRINSAKPGDKISLTLFINNETKDIEVILGKKS